MRRLRGLWLSLLVFVAVTAAAAPVSGMFGRAYALSGNQLQTGTSLLFKINVWSGSARQPGNSVTGTTYGVNRTAAIDLGTISTSGTATLNIPDVVRLENKSTALLALVSVTNGTSPQPLVGISSFIQALSVNLSLGTGTTTSLGVSYNPLAAKLAPKGVYTGFVTIRDNLLFQTYSIPIRIEIT